MNESLEVFTNSTTIAGRGLTCFDCERKKCISFMCITVYSKDLAALNNIITVYLDRRTDVRRKKNDSLTRSIDSEFRIKTNRIHHQEKHQYHHRSSHQESRVRTLFAVVVPYRSPLSTNSNVSCFSSTRYTFQRRHPCGCGSST